LLNKWGSRKRGRSAPLVTALITATALIATGPGAYASSGNNITATYMNSGTYNLAAQSLVGSFDKTAGVNVKIEAFPYAALQQNNTNAVISGQCTYNVVSGSYYLASIYSYFQNLDSYASKSNYAAGLIPGLWQHSEFYNGYHIGVPYGPDAYSLMYNTSLFSKAGLALPKTWSDLITDMSVLKQKLPSGCRRSCSQPVPSNSFRHCSS
jgi:ABC-type glycerol-3-phosphate transport system substrate-binding protein